MSLEPLLTAKEVVIVCGAGGVGKTTTAAAMAATAAVHLDCRVLALTVDPARRLATAMGLERFGNVEHVVDPEAFASAGVTPRGELWAAMLDTKASWDDLVRRHAPDVATREAILDNPLYRNITAKFVHSHDYIAMERLHELHASGRFDLIVVDTPPTRNAIDFLDAPERMIEFFSSRLIRWLVAPYGSRLVSAASKPFSLVADRVLGAQFVRDIAEFFLLLQTMEHGFVDRARAVTRTLEGRRSSFVVVSSLEPGPVRETEFFVDALARRSFHLGACVLNRTLPDYFRSRDGLDAAQAMTAQADELAALLGDDSDRDALAGVLREIAESFRNYRLVATREAEQLAELSVSRDLIVRVPTLERDVTSLRELLEIGGHLW